MQSAEVARKRRCNDAFCLIVFLFCLLFTVVMTGMVLRIHGFEMENKMEDDILTTAFEKAMSFNYFWEQVPLA